MFNQKEYNKQHKEQVKLNIKNYRQRKSHIYKMYKDNQLISKSTVDKSYISIQQLQYILKQLINQNQQEHQLLNTIIKQNKEILNNQSNQVEPKHPITNHNFVPITNHPNSSSSNRPAYQSKPDNNSIPDVQNIKATQRAILDLFNGNTLADTTGSFIINNYDNPQKMTKQKTHELINQLIEVNINIDKNLNNGTLSNRQWSIIINYLDISNAKYHQISNKDFKRLNHGRKLFKQKHQSNDKNGLTPEEKMYYKQNHMDDIYR